jgi:hypothetical protein
MGPTGFNDVLRVLLTIPNSACLRDSLTYRLAVLMVLYSSESICPMAKSPAHDLHLSTCLLPCRVISLLATSHLGRRLLRHRQMQAERGNRCSAKKGKDHLTGDSLKSAHHVEV